MTQSTRANIKEWEKIRQRGMLKFQEKQRKKNLEKLKAGTLYPKIEFKIRKVPVDKDIRWYKKVLWTWFSKFIRLRDSNEKGICACITCEREHKWNDGLLDAGHFEAKNKGNSIYFDEQDVNGQCRYCNKWLSGNLAVYRVKIDEKWGAGTADRLAIKARETKSFTEKELIEKINYYKIEVKKLLQIKDL